ncbi:hypothetical protein TRVA0_009S00100 [Trichomonascus vanleenenianus]|uniref:uncharacterized protein n=1 Tax=Trichomonascus vanleenenianus TaxID=2268995 RepID=UPI003EC99C6B
MGHIAKNCRTRISNEMDDSSKSSTANRQEWASCVSNRMGCGVDATTWVWNSGSTSHIALDKAVFTDYKECDEVLKAFSGSTRIIGTGTVVLTLDDGRIVKLNNVKHAPDGDCNLFSYTAALRRSVDFKFREDGGIDARFNGARSDQWVHFASLGDSGHQLLLNGVAKPAEKALAMNVVSKNLLHQRMAHAKKNDEILNVVAEINCLKIGEYQCVA